MSDIERELRVRSYYYLCSGAKDYFLGRVQDKHRPRPGKLSDLVLDCALFVVTCLITARGGEGTLGLGSEDLVLRTSLPLMR